MIESWNRRGMTLIEVMIAITILSVVLVAMGGMMYEVAQRTRKSAVATYRAAAAQHAIALVSALPFDSVVGQAGSVTDTTGALIYTRLITVASPSSTRRTVTIVISPTNMSARPDTQVVVRTKPRPPSPLNQ